MLRTHSKRGTALSVARRPAGTLPTACVGPAKRTSRATRQPGAPPPHLGPGRRRTRRYASSSNSPEPHDMRRPTRNATEPSIYTTRQAIPESFTPQCSAAVKRNDDGCPVAGTRRGPFPEGKHISYRKPRLPLPAANSFAEHRPFRRHSCRQRCAAPSAGQHPSVRESSVFDLRVTA